jgi:hypothetical protein
MVYEEISEEAAWEWAYLVGLLLASADHGDPCDAGCIGALLTRALLEVTPVAMRAAVQPVSAARSLQHNTAAAAFTRALSAGFWWISEGFLFLYNWFVLQPLETEQAYLTPGLLTGAQCHDCISAVHF